MNKLPPEILEHIFSYLDVEDLVRVQNVSITWNEISQSDYVWKNAVYAPSESTSYAQIKSILKHAPKIKEFLPSIPWTCWHCMNKFCPQLRKLRIDADHMCPSETSHLFRINESIEELEVFIRLVHPMQLRFLEKCFTLRSLKLHGHIYVSKFTFKMIAMCCPFLKNLDVQSLEGYEMQDLYTLVTTCQLESLKVTIWKDTFSPCLDVFGCSENMKSLTIDHSRTNISSCFDSFRLRPSVIDITFICPKYEDESFLIPLLMDGYFINLQRFELVGCHFSHTLANAVFRECPNLKTLKFSKSIGLTDGTLVFISELVHLQSLTLADCNEITDKAMKFISLCPNLRALHLLNCALLTDKAPESMESLKRLSRLVFKPSNPVDTPNST